MIIAIAEAGTGAILKDLHELLLRLEERSNTATDTTSRKTAAVCIRACWMLPVGQNTNPVRQSQPLSHAGSQAMAYAYLN